MARRTLTDAVQTGPKATASTPANKQAKPERPPTAGDRVTGLAALFPPGSFPEGRGKKGLPVARLQRTHHFYAGLDRALRIVAATEGCTISAILNAFIARLLAGRNLSPDVLPEAALAEYLAGEDLIDAELWERYRNGDTTAIPPDLIRKLLA